ncbi:MAG: 1-acyl-sn-glycerol-3-phosphate acyltransferase [Rhodospirillales bacterium]|nr:1-acyl-sn-glycerol-3-phosphate acyltransferase [Rhodospirillales bacterium]
MTVLRSALYQIAFLAWTLVLGILYLPVLMSPRPVALVAARIWIHGTLAMVRIILGIRWEIRGRDNLPPGPVVIAAKHQSAWDTLIFHALVPDPAYVLKKELLILPVVGWFLWKTDMVAIDRKAGIKALKFMAEHAKLALANRRQVIIFPEGTRTAVGAALPYHSGVAMLYGLGVPVVPVALNSGLLWPRDAFLRRAGKVILEILPAMPEGLDRKAFVRELQARIEGATARLVAEGTGADFSSSVDKSVDSAGRAGAGTGDNT